uniref:Bm1650 n=1 Tax=Brugia malayi TaxID=6279 RepID=A0A1I9G3Q8_BRUMA|nr:Bm1650 [Brugia malayi]
MVKYGSSGLSTNLRLCFRVLPLVFSCQPKTKGFAPIFPSKNSLLI